MKRRYRFISLVLLSILFILPLGGCQRTPEVETPTPTPTGTPTPDAKHGYRMALAYGEADRTLSGTITIDYANTADVPLTEAFFSLFPNAYRKEETAPFFPEEMGWAYPNGFSAGGIDIPSVMVDGNTAATRLEHADQTLLVVSLPHPLGVGERVSIAMEVTITLPNSLGRFGYGDRSINLCNFYPIACVYREGAFLAYPYYKAGDPFVSEVGTYDVTVTIPKEYVLAHSGNMIEKAEGETATTYTLFGENLRDFAMVLSKDFDVVTQQVGDVLVASYYYKEQPQEGKLALQYSVNTLQFMEAKGMPYPFFTLSTVQTDFFIGGMEYPTLTLIDKSLYKGGIRSSFEEVVVHEAIHQWFYAAVGSNQVLEPFLDEGTTNYLTIKYFGHTYGEKQEKLMRDYNLTQAAELYENYFTPKKEDTRVGSDMMRYDNFGVYNLAIYINGARMYYELEEAIGEDALFATLAQYYGEQRFRIATRTDWEKIFMDAYGKVAQQIFDKWL
ncbi:M1 family metallopeptidase [Eubacteriales bacterium OttesenSCG-928-M02]|nr:M1 family metallopeptidase [Eubacteriales bacterium OttesenSCG-928-M02]